MIAAEDLGAFAVRAGDVLDACSRRFSCMLVPWGSALNVLNQSGGILSNFALLVIVHT